jgi:hypothetical protein
MKRHHPTPLVLVARPASDRSARRTSLGVMEAGVEPALAMAHGFWFKPNAINDFPASLQ